MFNRIIIIGLGLIGGSIAKDARKHRLSHQILAYDKDPLKLDFALSNKIIDQIYDFKEKIGDEDLVIIAVPISAYKEIADSLLEVLGKKSIIIDVGSVKSFIGPDILPLLQGFAHNFVPCHPIAGLEKSGVESAVEDLFLGKKLIITQNEITDISAVNKIIDFWEKIGAKIEFLSDQSHDKIFALTSHLPQFISHQLSALDFLNLESKNEVITKHLRLEKSSLAIWKDIFDYNHIYLDSYAKEYAKNIDLIYDQIANSDYQNLIELLQKSYNNFANGFNINLDFSKDLNKALLLRILAVSSYASIKDLHYYQDYCGSGFRDFTIILSYLKFLSQNQGQLIDFTSQNQQYFLQSLKKIKG